MCPFRFCPGFAVSQFFYSVHDPNGDRSAANRAKPFILHGFNWGESRPAFPVAVKMILSLLGKVLKGPQKTLWITGFQCVSNCKVGKVCVKKVCFPSQIGRRMGIGIGDQSEPIEE